MKKTLIGAEETKNENNKVLLKPLMIWFFVLLAPISLATYYSLNWYDMTIGLMILLCIFFSALGAVLGFSIQKFIPYLFSLGKTIVENFKKRNGYYPKTKYHAYAELWLRVIRVFAIFYLTTTPFYYDFNNSRVIIGATLLCMGIIGIATIIIKKIRIRPDVV